MTTFYQTARALALFFFTLILWKSTEETPNLLISTYRRRNTFATELYKSYALRFMVRLVLFDIDGTLVRTGGAGVKAFAKVFETEFGARDGFENLKFGGRTDVSLVREFFGVHNIAATAENFQRFFGRYVFWLDQILQKSETATCPGVREFIRQLQELGAPPVLGLLTGNIRLGAEIKLRHFDLWKVFATGGFADDHEDRDQIAAIARERGCGILGQQLRDEQVLVIGDTPLDIRCARAIRAKVLAVATGGSTLEELRHHAPDWVFTDLRAVTAKQIVENGRSEEL